MKILKQDGIIIIHRHKNKKIVANQINILEEKIWDFKNIIL